MKTILIITALILSSNLYSQETKRALFIGNSYTYYNNLPQLTATLALSAGDTLIFDNNTPGGYTLNQHSTNATSLAKIQQGGWDFVVLQEQSQLPSFPIGQVQTQSFPYAQFLDSVIKATDSCTETMFYMTWGRENGDASNCPTWPPVCTYEGMDSLLRLRYDQMAVDNQGVVSPVGPLWKYLRTNYPTLELYSSDGSHPSLEGSYAAACSFYSTIFRKDPTLISDDAGLDPMIAMYIRDAAKLVVFDSLATWHVGEYDPVASFTTVTSFLSVVCTNTSSNLSANPVSYSWDFGDGSAPDTVVNPIHVYNDCGAYNITLTLTSCGMSFTFVDSIQIPNSGPPCGWGLSEMNMLSGNQISPNPVSSILQIKMDHIDNCTLIDPLGKETKLNVIKTGSGYQIDLSQIAAGVYWLKVENDGRFYVGKVVKE